MEAHTKIQSIFVKAAPTLFKSLTIDDAFLRELVARDVITGEQRETFANIQINGKKVDNLLEIIKRTTGAYNGFMEFLNCDKRMDLYNMMNKLQDEAGLHMHELGTSNKVSGISHHHSYPSGQAPKQQKTDTHPHLSQQQILKSTTISDIHQVEYAKFKIQEKIGKGVNGEVHRVTFEKAHKGYTEAAVKTVVHMTSDEVEMLSNLSHPNIVKVLGSFPFVQGNLLVLELAPGGSLYDYIYQRRKIVTPIPENLIRKWLKECALAIKYLHENNIIHMDIKSTNCLLFHPHVLKLSDFGLNAKRDDLYNQKGTQINVRETWRYMAPELLKAKQKNVHAYSKDTDIFSYGMLIFEICASATPYAGMTIRDWFESDEVILPTIPATCPKDLSNLMLSCWKANPKERPTIERVIYDLVYEELLLMKSTPGYQRLSLRQYSYCPEKLQTLDHKGGTIIVTGTGACLTVPPKALPPGPVVELSMSVHWGNDYPPPLQSNNYNDSVIGPVVSCEPAGLKFQRKVKITLPHSARNITKRHITIWTKKSSSPEHQWKILDKDYDLDEDENTISIWTDHFTLFTVSANLIQSASLLRSAPLLQGAPLLQDAPLIQGFNYIMMYERTVPEPADPVPQPTDPRPEPTDPRQEPTDTTPEPIDPVPQPTDTIPEPTDPIHESTDPIPESTDPIPESTDPISEPTVPVLEPTDPRTEPTDPRPEPTDPRPEPTYPVPQPTDTISEPTDPIPETTDPASEPTVPVLEPTDPMPEPTDPTPKPTDPVPEPTDPVPQPTRTESYNDRVMLPFLFPPDLGRETVFVTVYAARRDEIQSIKACEDGVLCGPPRPLLAKEGHGPLTFTVKYIDPQGCWTPEEDIQEIQLGGCQSFCTVMFRKRPNTLVNDIMGFINALQNNEHILIRSRFSNPSVTTEREPQGVQTGLVSQKDIQDIVDIFSWDDLDDVYTYLKQIERKDVRNASRAHPQSPKQQAKEVLNLWCTRNSEAATRDAMIRAMMQCRDCRASVHKLKRKWGYSLND